MIEQKQLEASIAKAAADVRANNPLAGSITNTVTIDFVANAQLAVGGSAAMVYLPDEGETLVAAGGAVYLNMGTLFPIYEETIPRTAAAAQAAGKPWVLDPVGIGIGSLRTKLLSELKQHKPACGALRARPMISRAPAASIPPIRWRLHVRRLSRWLAIRKALSSSPASPTWSPTGIRSSSAMAAARLWARSPASAVLRAACLPYTLRKPIRSRPLLPR